MPPVFPSASEVMPETAVDLRQQQFQRILLEATDAPEALSLLYQCAKNNDKKFSLSFLCRKLGLSSKGFISDVMKGRRQLGAKYWDALVDTFALDVSYAELLRLLLSIEAEKDAKQALLMREELSIKRKSLTTSRKILSRKLRGMFFSFDVFCAFGLFQNEPTKKQLRDYFGVERGVELEVALNILLTTGLIEKVGDLSYRLTKNQIRFSDSEDGISHLDFLKESIEDARRSVEKWKEKPEETIFASNIISVKKSDYLKTIDRLRREMLEIQSDLESEDADLLIRFNIQVYPS